MRLRWAGGLAGAMLLLGACTTGGTTTSSTPSTSGTGAASAAAASGSAPTDTTGSVAAADPALAAAVMAVVSQFKEQNHLQAVLVKVTRGDGTVVEQAVGESMTGVPATTDMHFRNGAVAISYMSTLLLILVDEGKVSLDDKVSTVLPDLPHADEVTFGQLAQMTSGYVDFEQTPELTAANYADPFKQWTPDELLAFAVGQPLYYTPGTNWNYAHTNYLLLGMALEKATGQEMSKLLSDKVLRPLGLTNTDNNLTPEIPSPALHAFSSERRAFLKIPAGTSFYEESTFWDPSWTITHGAIQTTNIYDMEATAVGIGSGRLLTADSYKKMVSPDLRGKTHKQPGCTTCDEMTNAYTYGLGIVITGNWLLQNPMFGGYGAIEAYLPSQKIAIAAAVTFNPEAFDDQGDYDNAADPLFRKIAAELAPEDAPPLPPKK